MTLTRTDGGAGGHPHKEKHKSYVWEGSMNGMKWFRVYSEIKDDPKILEMDDHQRWLWICLLAMASESTDRGTITNVRLRGLAASLRTDEARLLDTLQLLADLEMIDYDEDARMIAITHWDDRQYDKPSNSPSATRDRKRKSRESHADVTPCHAIEENRIEESREDTEILTAYAVSAPVEQPAPEQAPKAKRTAAKPDTTPLLFDPVQDTILVEVLTAHYESIDRKPPAKFQNTAQRDGYRMAAAFLGPDKTRRAVTQCVVGQRYAIGDIVTSLLRWVDNEKRGGVRTAQPVNEPKGFAAIREYMSKHGMVPNGVT